MKLVRGVTIGVAFAALAMIGPSGVVGADNDRDGRLRADLIGFEEPPAVSTTGRGTFRATVDRDGNGDPVINYRLRFSDLEGLVTQSHIHIGQFSVNGGIALWLCQTARNPAPTAVADATPLCNDLPDANEGDVSGTLTAAQVIGPAGQGIAPGEFEEVLKAMRGRVAYVNVHSTRNPGGEIRGQIRGGGGDDDN